MAPDRAALLAEVKTHNWHHRIDLGDGVVTPGGVNTPRVLATLGLPESLEQKTVLDIGAWDGFYSFEAERRGAARVLATDSFIWEGGIPYTSKAGFELARRTLGSRVEDRTIDVMDLSPAAVGTFDLVLFLGVLYHLRHPLLALERVFSVTGEQLILETHIEHLRTRRPAMMFYPGAELAEDPTNWWGPNVPAVSEMLRAVGFPTVRLVHLRRRRRRRSTTRAVLHAFR